MLSIDTNLSSLIAQQSMSSATNKLNQAIERMTTGYKINGAKDNAANYSISTNMTTKINSYMVAEDNVAMGLDMLSTANGSLDQISDKLTRLRALATQASNGTYGTQSLTAINSEANALVDEINRIYSTAEYNGRKLFSGGNANEANGVAAASTFGMARTASTNTTYTNEEVAAMTSISDVSTFTDGGFYSISSAEELARLAELTNSGVDTTGATFVLANDIDLDEWCEARSADGGWTPIGTSSKKFKGIFDGNGHVISNLQISRQSTGYQGLFGAIYYNVELKNVGLVNVDIIGKNLVGSLVGQMYSNSTVSNSYVTGNITGYEYVGGLVGDSYGIVNNCYAITTVTGNSRVGGLVGWIDNLVANSFAESTVVAESRAGGLVGLLRGDVVNCYSKGSVSVQTNAVGGITGSSFNGVIKDSYTICSVVSASGDVACGGIVGMLDTSASVENSATSTFIGDKGDGIVMTEDEILEKYTLDYMGFTSDNGWKIVNGSPYLSWQQEAQFGYSLYGSCNVSFQVGIDSDDNNQINLEFSFFLENIAQFRNIGLDTSIDYLTEIDNMLNTVTAKATEYGAVQNRLESALDEIAIQYDNLVSSRSTLRDADIAEVSSQYIQQQILQQASATLLATANQSPSIALQLI